MTADRGARRTDRAPRVLLVTHSYRPDRTPPARRWAAVVAALRADGWEVDVVTPGGVRTVLGEDGERLRRTPALLPGELSLIHI